MVRAVYRLVLRKPPQSNAKRHHLVPEWYTRRFAHDGRRVYVFDRSTGKVRQDVPHNIAVESEFNSVTRKTGTKDRSAEGRLAELDDIAATCVRKLDAGEPLSREERWYVSFFISYSDARSRGFREATLREMPPAIDYSKPGRDFLDDRFVDALCSVSGVILDRSTIERMITDSMQDVAAGAFEIGSMAQRAFELARHVFWSEWGIVVAEEGSLFVTSDRPLGVLAQPASLSDDPFDPAAIKALPLSPSRAVVFRGGSHERPLRCERVPSLTVRLINAAIAFRYDRELIAPSERLLEQTLSDTLLFQCAKLGISHRAVLMTA